MEVFGPQWEGWTEKIAHSWKAQVTKYDLVLIPGDISWALREEEVLPDLEWIDSLPGMKVMIRGNHDYWWSSKSKVKKLLPPSIHIIQNDAFDWRGVSIGGARLWDSPEYQFGEYIVVKGEDALVARNGEGDKIFERELQRLELSLKALDQNAASRIVMTHYPPIGATLVPSASANLLQKYRVDHVVFGHLHSLKPSFRFPKGETSPFYHLVSCDYLNFSLDKII